MKRNQRYTKSKFISEKYKRFIALGLTCMLSVSLIPNIAFAEKRDAKSVIVDSNLIKEVNKELNKDIEIENQEIDLLNKKTEEKALEQPEAPVESAREKIKLRSETEVITKEDMEYVKNIDASNKGIKDISGLEHAINLKTLNLENNEIRDISNLKGLANLETVNIANQNITLEKKELAGSVNTIENPIVGIAGSKVSNVTGENVSIENNNILWKEINDNKDLNASFSEETGKGTFSGTINQNIIKKHEEVVEEPSVKEEVQNESIAESTIPVETNLIYTNAEMTEQLRRNDDYSYPVETTLYFNGTAQLNGVEITSGTKVTTTGVHRIKKGNLEFNFGIVNNINGKEIVSISSGDHCTIALDNDGDMYGWGSCVNGVLGTNGAKVSPIKLSRGEIPTDAKIIKVEAGYWHAMALDNKGNMYAWGSNAYGEGGTGSGAKTEPTLVLRGDIPNDAKIIDIELGSRSSKALDDQGNIYAWGYNGNLELGTSSGNKATPTLINKGEIDSRIVTIEMSHATTHAIDSNGQLYAWGYNGGGAIGDGGASSVLYPKKITTTNPIVQVNAGEQYTMLLDNKGQILTTGKNIYGQQANGTIGGVRRSFLPIKNGEIPMTSKVKFIGGGDDTPAVVTENGDIFMWGNNSSGEVSGHPVLKTGYTVPKKIVYGDIKDASQIISIPGQSDAIVALSADGNIYSWGHNDSGQLGIGKSSGGVNGDGHNAPRETVVTMEKEAEIREDETNVYIDVTIENANDVTKAVYTEDEVPTGTSKYTASTEKNGNVHTMVIPKLVGGNPNALLGKTVYVSIGIDGKPVENINEPNPIPVKIPKAVDNKIYTNAEMTEQLRRLENYIYPVETTLYFNGTALLDGVEITSGTKVTTTGAHRIKNGNLEFNFGIVNNVNGKEIVSMAADIHMVFAVASDGSLYNYNNNEPFASKLNGDGDIGAETKIVSVSSAGLSNFAVDSVGNLYAWGENMVGQLGDGTRIDSYNPKKINGYGDIGAETKIVSVINNTGSNNARVISGAIDSEGNLYTWGSGIGYLAKKVNGTGDIGASTHIVSASFGTEACFAIDSEGNLYAWRGVYGALPKKVNGDIGLGNKIISIVTDSITKSSSAIDSEGNLYSWSSGGSPQKINGKGDIGTGTKIISTHKGWGSDTAIDSEGNLYAWGNNDKGNLMIGNTVYQDVPVKVNGIGDIGSGTKIIAGKADKYASAALDSDGNLYWHATAETNGYDVAIEATLTMEKEVAIREDDKNVYIDVTIENSNNNFIFNKFSGFTIKYSLDESLGSYEGEAKRNGEIHTLVIPKIVGGKPNDLSDKIVYLSMFDAIEKRPLFNLNDPYPMPVKIPKIEDGMMRLEVPVSVAFQVATNALPDAEFVTADYEIRNNSSYPVNVSLEKFTTEPGGLEIVPPTTFADWDNISKEDTMSKIALGLYPKSGFTDTVNTETSPIWLGNGLSTSKLGSVPKKIDETNPSKSVFTFTAKHGKNFDETSSQGKYKMTLKFSK